MGWWSLSKKEGDRGGLDLEKALSQTEGGDTSTQEENKEVMGDEPADIMEYAVDQIVETYQEEWDRPPTGYELLMCFIFSSGHLDGEDGEPDIADQIIDAIDKFQR